MGEVPLYTAAVLVGIKTSLINDTDIAALHPPLRPGSRSLSKTVRHASSMNLDESERVYS